MTLHPISPHSPPDQRERQHLASLHGELANLRSNPAAWELNEAMSKAYADKQHAIAAPGPYHADQQPWERLDEDGRNVVRLGCMAATEAARWIKAEALKRQRAEQTG